MKISIAFLFITVSFCLSSCLFDSSSDTITKDYRTTWIDIPQTRSIEKGETIVPAYVSDIGHNTKYIIAKQHPIKDGNITIVHTDTTNYYIVEITTNSFQDKPIYGPLNLRQFDSLCRKLDIENVKFNMHYTEY